MTRPARCPRCFARLDEPVHRQLGRCPRPPDADPPGPRSTAERLRRPTEREAANRRRRVTGMDRDEFLASVRKTPEEKRATRAAIQRRYKARQRERATSQ